MRRRHVAHVMDMPYMYAMLETRRQTSTAPPITPSTIGRMYVVDRSVYSVVHMYIAPPQTIGHRTSVDYNTSYILRTEYTIVHRTSHSVDYNT